MPQKTNPPPDTLEIQFIARDGSVTETISWPVNHTTPATHDDQAWTEAVAFDEFCAAVREPNGDRCRAAMGAFDRLQCWDAIWLRLSEVAIDDAFRQNFRSRVTESGFRFRSSVRDLRHVIVAFRHLLPPYSGPDLHLYRGELASKHDKSDDGFSWTTSIEVARMFANRRISIDQEPGVLLEATAPAVEAIIAAPDSHSIHLGEYEYIVDPRALKDIRVIE